MSKGATVLQPDTLLFGKYQILSAIGEGGYGQVYLAHDLAMNRRVAIKELLRDVATQDDVRWRRFQARFRREAQTVGQFEHPNVVGAYALESDAEGNLYLVLEYVDGGSLEQALNAGAPLKTERALAIATDICRAIDAIYRRDIVHRDIKPSNILLVAEPTPGGPVAKLTDFGVAQVGRDTRRTQDVVAHPGTPAYMSPEQATTSGYLDQRSDLYALGLVLYEMLTGESYVRNLVSPRERNLAVPASLDAVVMRALCDEPSERYQNAAEMLSDLQHVRDQRLLGQFGILLRAIRPRQIAAWVGVLLVAALLYGSVRLNRALRLISAGVTPTAALTAGLPATLTPALDWPTATPSLSPQLTVTPTLSAADPYEPDDAVPVTLSIGEVLTRAFDPDGDIDRIAFRVKAGRSYLVTTSNLAIGVDTRLEVQVDGQLLANDDQSPGTLASQVLFTAPADGTVIAYIYNQDQFGPERTYDVSVVVVEPTATPTETLTPTLDLLATITPRATNPLGTVSPSPTWTLRPSLTTTATYTPTRTRTVTPTRTPTRTVTVSRTPTVSPTRTLSPTITRTPSVTPTVTPARTLPPVRTPYPSR